ncbi:hypothetical protein GPL22_05300 [Anaerostipes hadrus]|nr:hypothetical protein [Anaerostipes hadrus]
MYDHHLFTKYIKKRSLTDKFLQNFFYDHNTFVSFNCSYYSAIALIFSRPKTITIPIIKNTGWNV